MEYMMQAESPWGLLSSAWPGGMWVHTATAWMDGIQSEISAESSTRIEGENKSMKAYTFRKLADDGTVWTFKRFFPSAYRADRWATAKWEKWWKGEISYRIVFAA